MTFFIAGLALAALAALFSFFLSPLGLGPEPEKVLPGGFFKTPSTALGNLKLLVDGEEAFAAIMELVQRAEKSVIAQTLIWRDDETGREVVSALVDAANRGVKVSVSKDMAGTFFEAGDIIRGRPSPVFADSHLRKHKSIEVHTSLFADTDHSKYFIADGTRAVFGGMNIGDEYHRLWHDFMVMAESPEFVEAFESRVVDGERWPCDNGVFVAVNSRKACEIRRALLEAIGRARESVVLDHAYFSDTNIINALVEAAGRGVRVDVILPKAPDIHLYANMTTINLLLASCPPDRIGVHLYPRMSHSKVGLIDGVIAVVGSANLTGRSMKRSREVALFAHGRPDDPFIERLRGQILSDIAASEKVTAPLGLSIKGRIAAALGAYIW